MRQWSIGYPGNYGFDYSEIMPWCRLPMNNIGDPFVKTSYVLNTHALEREALEWFAEKVHAPPRAWWGYITTGGTEGNRAGLMRARTAFPEAPVFFSQASHYSVAKIIAELRMTPRVVGTDGRGCMDLEDLRAILRKERRELGRREAAIVLLNVGTTMTGAVDDVRGIRRVLAEEGVTRSYLHADAAKRGMTLPFLDHPDPWDFREGIDSLTVSGHKFLGIPFPCGIFLARSADAAAKRIEYIDSVDATSCGSRSGHAALFFWYAFHAFGVSGIRSCIQHSLDTAAYAVNAFRCKGIDAWRHDNAMTVVFDGRRAPPHDRWMFAQQGDVAHIITLSHLSRREVDRFVANAAMTPDPAK